MISEKHLIINPLGGTSEPAPKTLTAQSNKPIDGQVLVEKDTVPRSQNTHPSV